MYIIHKTWVSGSKVGTVENLGNMKIMETVIFLSNAMILLKCSVLAKMPCSYMNILFLVSVSLSLLND